LRPMPLSRRFGLFRRKQPCALPVSSSLNHARGAGRELIPLGGKGINFFLRLLQHTSKSVVRVHYSQQFSNNFKIAFQSRPPGHAVGKNNERHVQHVVPLDLVAEQTSIWTRAVRQVITFT
jgi:hypothetical protein